MTSGNGDLPQVPCFETESWANLPKETPLGEILSITDDMASVWQNNVREFYPEDRPTHIVSEGFLFCTGLLLRSQDDVYTFSHLSATPDAWDNYIRRRHWETPRDAVLFYGSDSARQRSVEQALREGLWGPVNTIRAVCPDTSSQHWGMAINTHLGQAAIVRRDPDQSVLRYQVFEPGK